MGKSIDAKPTGSRFHPTPRLIPSMSLQLAIPRRGGLHQSPPPLHQPRTTLAEIGRNEHQNPANGKLSKCNLSQPRGSPQTLSSPPARTISPNQLIPPEI